MDGIKTFNNSMTGALIKNKRFLLKRPEYLPVFAKISSNMKKQEKVREALAKEGVVVPLFL